MKNLYTIKFIITILFFISFILFPNPINAQEDQASLLLDLKKQGIKEFPLTDMRMTRFWITLEDAVNLAIKALEDSEGGEVFVPKIPSMKMVALAKAIDPDCRFKIIGIRPGEKVHETLISEDEAGKVKLFDGVYVILPQFFETKEVHRKYEKCPCVPQGFVYRSDKNDVRLSVKELQRMIEELKNEDDPLRAPAYRQG